MERDQRKGGDWTTAAAVLVAIGAVLVAATLTLNGSSSPFLISAVWLLACTLALIAHSQRVRSKTIEGTIHELEGELETMKLGLDKIAPHWDTLGARASRLYRSPHHLFESIEVLQPKSTRRVDVIFDPADLPQGLLHYATTLHADGIELRLLLLDPDSLVVERHRLALEPDSSPDFVRSRMRKAIEQLLPYATIRLFDAQPPGNLLIVDDHIIWGGSPSVPSDVPLPLFELKVDTHEQTYWAFRRNFDALWERARPLDTKDSPDAPLKVARSN